MSHSNKHNKFHDIGCLNAIEGLYTWLDGELKDPQSITQIEEHISHCQSCYSRAEMEKLLTMRIRNLAKQESAEHAPEALQNRLHKLIDQF
jgi:anti-sigma factor (TIGR02949 family)